MFWTKPKDEHIIYEALSAIADSRLEMIGDNKAKCTSTSRGKYYDIEFDSELNSIMSNDNMAFYIGEVSYPMVAYLLLNNIIKFDHNILGPFKDIKWKDINQKNKNDFMKSVKEVLETISQNGIDTNHIEEEVNRIFNEINKLNLKYLGNKKLPPKAY